MFVIISGSVTCGKLTFPFIYEEIKILTTYL
jgi:hypothetical protein